MKYLDSSTFLPVSGRTKTLRSRFKVSVANHSNSESHKTNDQSKTQVLLEILSNKNYVLKQNCFFQSVLNTRYWNTIYILFISYLAAPELILDHCRGGSLTNSMLITTFDTYLTQRSSGALQQGSVPKPGKQYHIFILSPEYRILV